MSLPRTDKFRALSPHAQSLAIALLEPLLNLVASDIVPERARQDEQWGGPENDDTRNMSAWVEYIDKQLEFVTAHVQGQRELNPGEFRERMIKVSALAIAAIQAYDRAEAADDAVAQEKCNCPACQLEAFLTRGGNGPDIRTMVLDGADAALFVEALLSRRRGRG